MSGAQGGFGTELKYAAGTVVGELTSIGGPGLSADTIDVSNHQSADGYREFIQGMKDGGEVSCEGNFLSTDAGQVALLGSFDSGAVESMVITFPDGSNFEFDAIVTGYEPSAPFDGKISFSATMKVTGKPVFGS